jgi:N-methylhydantoinase A
MGNRPLVHLAADIGGTFTDIVLEVGNERFTKKVLTTAKYPELGVLSGAGLVLDEVGLSYADIDVFVHGTTLATNAVLERSGALTALIATEGFRDVIEIGTEGRFDQYDLQIEKQIPLVPRALRLTVPERIDARGRTLLELDEESLVRLIRRLREEKIESIALAKIEDSKWRAKAATSGPVRPASIAKCASSRMPFAARISASSLVRPDSCNRVRSSPCRP